MLNRNQRLNLSLQKLADVPMNVPKEDMFPPEENLPELTPYVETVEKPPWKAMGAVAAVPWAGYYGYKGAKKLSSYLPGAVEFMKKHSHLQTPATLAAASVGTVLTYMLLRLGERSRSTQKWYERELTGTPHQPQNMQFVK